MESFIIFSSFMEDFDKYVLEYKYRKFMQNIVSDLEYPGWE